MRMTYQDALKRIEADEAWEREFLNTSDNPYENVRDLHEQKAEAYATAAEALKSCITNGDVALFRVPMQVEGRRSTSGTLFCKCPHCANAVSFKSKFCVSCGQALKWGEDPKE